MEKESIISKIHKENAEIEDYKISDAGYISTEEGKRRGVRKKVFEGPDGRHYYVYKEVRDLDEAERTMDIYGTFKRLGIPVAGFAKIIKKRVGESDEFIVAMEDLTDDDKLEVVEIFQLKDWFINKGLLIPQEIKIGMVQALARIHNEGIFDFHPGLSFALRVKKIEGEDDFSVFDFRVIDYANFMREGVPGIPLPKVRSVAGVYKEEQVEDLNFMLTRVTIDNREREYLKKIYRNERSEKSEKTD